MRRSLVRAMLRRVNVVLICMLITLMAFPSVGFSITDESDVSDGWAVLAVAGDGEDASSDVESEETGDDSLALPEVISSENCQIWWDDNDDPTVGTTYRYTGEPIEPKPCLNIDGQLVPTADAGDESPFVVTYENNINVGVATITITGKEGLASGSVTGEFTISPVPMEELAVDSIPDQMYTGDWLTPPVTVRFGSTVLSPDSDYEAIYENNLEVGESATVTLQALEGSNYSGSVVVSFRIVPRTGTWRMSGSRWWYQWADGTYPAAEATVISGKTYRFDASGYMRTGWVQDDGTWYWHNSSGAMVTGWQKISGTWYWFDGNGAMATGWQNIGGKKYYFKSSGAMASGWQQIDGTWYWFNSSGTMVTGWQKISGTWYWFDSNGAMATGWLEISGARYYLKPSGAMATGWQQIGGSWYWFNGSGVMVAGGWQKVSGAWYWFNPNGTMATGWLEYGGSWYYLKSSGAMATGWQKIGGDWYYFASSGAMCRSRWVGNSYVGDDGVMLTSCYTPDGYWVNANGVYVPPAPATVYWVPNGVVYHSTKSCPSLARSRVIYSGTIAQSGKSRACPNCH